MTTCETALLETLERTLDDLKDQIRNRPNDVKLRIFLFQLLAVTGDWGRAQSQLNVCGQMDDANLAMMHTYRSLLHCEALRRDVFLGTRHPLVFGQPQEWMALLLESLRLEAAGEHATAGPLRDRAYAQAEPARGQIRLANESTEDFAWVADADSRLAPVLEAVVEGKYYWIPWTCLKRLDIEAPHDLRDVVWLPAYFTWTNGGEAAGFIPTRYVGSEKATDDLRLARKTEWSATPASAYHGLGQRMLATDRNEYALMDVRRLTFDAAADPHAEGSEELDG